MSPKRLLGLAVSTFLTLGSLLTAGVPEAFLVKDIADQENRDVSIAEPVSFKDGGLFVFASQSQLYFTDGTPGGTVPIKDNIGTISEIVPVGDQAFFVMDDPQYGKELWVTDGTPEGTRLVVDLVKQPGAGSQPRHLAAFNSGVMFVAESDGYPTALWWTDGTVEGTQLVHLPDSTGIFKGQDFVLSSTAEMDGHFYFVRLASQGRNTLWKSDGTPEGTTMLLAPSNAHVMQFQGIVGENLLFTYNFGLRNERALWKTDGSLKGTVQIKKATAPYESLNLKMVVIGDHGYFPLSSPESGSELWVTDGTEAGTRLAHDRLPGSAGLNFHDIKAVGTRLILHTSVDWTHHLWSYDTVTEQTQLLMTLTYSSRLMVEGTDEQVFLRYSHSGGYHLLTTDGTVAGTVGLLPGLSPSDSEQNKMAAIPGNRVILVAAQGNEAERLWCSDGTPAGTQAILAVTHPRTPSADPKNFRSANGRLYFSAYESVHGRELWTSDGTALGTYLIRDIYPGSASSNPAEMTRLDGLVYFAATSNTGRELWSSNGTIANLAKDIYTGLPIWVSSSPHSFVTHGGDLYFLASDGTSPSPDSPDVWRIQGLIHGGSHPITKHLPLGSAEEPITMAADLQSGGQSLYFTGRYAGTQGSVLYHFDPNTLSSLTYTPEAFIPTSIQLLPSADEEADLPDVFFLGYPPPSDTAPDTFYAFLQGSETPSFIHGWFKRSPATFKLTSLQRIQPESDFVFSLEGDLIGQNATTYTLWRSDLTTEGTHPLLPQDTGNQRLLAVLNNKVFYLHQPLGREDADLCWTNFEGDQQQVLITGGLKMDTKLVHTSATTLYLANRSSNPEDHPPLWRTQGTPESTWAVPGALVASSQDSEAVEMTDRLYFNGWHPKLGGELYALPLRGILHVQEIQPDESAVVLSEGATVDFGTAIVSGTPLSHTLRLRNVGDRNLINVQFTGPALADYVVSPASLNLPVGAEAEIEITFAPTTSGERSSSLQIGSGPVTHSLQLKGRGLAADALAEADGLRAAQILLAGETLSFQPRIASGSPVTAYSWQQNGIEIATTPSLTIPNVQLGNLLPYTLDLTNSTGTHTAATLRHAVIVPVDETLWPVPGSTVTLSCQAAAPPGTVLSYQWLRDGLPVVDFDRILGGQTATLTLASLQPGDSGTYRCEVTFSGPGFELSRLHGSVKVLVEEQPTLQLPYMWNYAGEEVTYQISSERPMAKFQARGLPPGLVMDANGLITGRIKTPVKGQYQVTITATSLMGQRVQSQFYWTIWTPFISGSYEGLLDRNGDMDGQLKLGTQIKFTSTYSQGVSGQLLHAGKVRRFAGMILTEADVNGGYAVGHIQLPATKGQPEANLTLRVLSTYTGTDCEITLEIDGQTTQGKAYRYGFNYQDTYRTATLQSSSESIALGAPEGTGYLTFSQKKAGRTVSVKGKLADGTPLMGTFIIAEADSDSLVIPLHIELYRSTGSLHGYLSLTRFLDSPISGTLTWNKAPNSKDRLYPDGIPLHDLTVEGGLHTPPARGELLFDLTANTAGDTSPNLTLTASGPNLPDETFQQQLLLSAGNKFKLPKVSPETPLKSLTFNTRTGTFKGSFTLLHESDEKLNRTTTFEGILPNEISDQAQGFFLLPDLPEEEGETLKNTAIQSGTVEIRQIPE